MAKYDYKEQLRKLKESKGSPSKQLTEQRKTHSKIHKEIINAVKDEPKTPPEIAETIQLPSTEVFWHVNALRKYNKLEIVKKKGTYMLYKPVGGEET